MPKLLNAIELIIGHYLRHHRSMERYQVKELRLLLLFLELSPLQSKVFRALEVTIAKIQIPQIQNPQILELFASL